MPGPTTKAFSPDKAKLLLPEGQLETCDAIIGAMIDGDRWDEQEQVMVEAECRHGWWQHQRT